MTRTPLPVQLIGYPIDRDSFFREILRELSGALEDVVGLDQAEGFVSVVGQRIAESIDQGYREALGAPRLSAEQVGHVLVDLKERIGGRFRIVAQDESRIVLRNSACPFGDRVLGRPALCMMTSNVFGAIAASNLGYARVTLQATIANGDDGCDVVIDLHPQSESAALSGREYFAR